MKARQMQFSSALCQPQKCLFPLPLFAAEMGCRVRIAVTHVVKEIDLGWRVGGEKGELWLGHSLGS